MTTATADPSIVDDPPPPAKSFVHHAKLIGGLTLVSRFFGLGREVAVTHYLGTGWVASAFAAAFAVPNLFRKLFGEGALSAAFIPLYAQQVKTQSTEAANGFAAAAVNLLIAILVGLTVVGELVIAGLLVWAKLPGRPVREDFVLTLKLAAVMLPYVLLICGGAFLSGILQVHKRFGVPAATPIILNAVQIVVLLVGAHLIHLGGRADGTAVEAKQLRLAYGLAAFVLVAGALQVAVLLPSLREAGFRFRFVPHFWTPAVKAMLVRSVPVALGAGVLQLSVLLDKSITLLLVQGVDTHDQLVATFRFMGRAVRLPMEIGALKRLDVAQFLYQFPLGIFAIALATAIFPGLSADALDHDRERFRAVLRQGIRASLWEGIPASLGLILVAGPATKLLFLNGHVSTHDADLIARSTAVYAAADVGRQPGDQPGGGDPPAVVARRGRHGRRHAGQLRGAVRGHAVDARPQGGRARPAPHARPGGQDGAGHGRDGRCLLRGGEVPPLPPRRWPARLGGPAGAAAVGRRGRVPRRLRRPGRAHDGRPAATAVAKVSGRCHPPLAVRSTKRTSPANRSSHPSSVRGRPPTSNRRIRCDGSAGLGWPPYIRSGTNGVGGTGGGEPSGKIRMARPMSPIRLARAMFAVSGFQSVILKMPTFRSRLGSNTVPGRGRDNRTTTRQRVPSADVISWLNTAARSRGL
jgi:putative peptidoglycan lipid II flippase